MINIDVHLQEEKRLNFLLASEYVLGGRLGPALRWVQCSQLLLEGQGLKTPPTHFMGCELFSMSVAE